MKEKIGICYYRSLFSQSASSLSVGKFSDYLHSNGYEAKLYLLNTKDNSVLISNVDKLLKNNIIIYKANYKDFEIGIRLFKNLLKNKENKFYLTGPFAVLNKVMILKKYDFIDGIIDIQNSEEIKNYFPTIGKPKTKKTIISGVDREIEFQEKGKYINLEASSGCIYNCSFCHIKLLNYNKYEKDLTLLVDEIDYLVNTMGKKYLIFNDSVFWKNSSDNERIKKFVEDIKSKNIKFNFMIYLSLSIKIPEEILKLLKEIGLIRVFFGVENISKDFSKNTSKFTSAVVTKKFIDTLNKYKISYHIGFILFSPYTKYEDTKDNIDFLHSIKKLYRPGILVEKMRILPGSKDENLLFYKDTIIDQAYNYKIKDNKCEKYYNLLTEFFKSINIRDFEQFFTGINLGISILEDRHIVSKYELQIKEFKKILDKVNDDVYDILISIYENLNYSDELVNKIKDLYAFAEANYIKFMNKLKKEDLEVYQMIPHGKEELNIW